MKTRKIFVVIGVVIIGAFISALINKLIGVSFKDVGIIPQAVHTMIYMTWGGILLETIRWIGWIE